VKSKQWKTMRICSGNSAGNGIQKEKRSASKTTTSMRCRHEKQLGRNNKKPTHYNTYLLTSLPPYLPTYLPTSTHNQCFFFSHFFFWYRDFGEIVFLIRNFHYQKKNSKKKSQFLSLSKNSEISPGKKNHCTQLHCNFSIFQFFNFFILKVCWVQRGFFFSINFELILFF
jgi:hypothetical protein